MKKHAEKTPILDASGKQLTDQNNQPLFEIGPSPTRNEIKRQKRKEAKERNKRYRQQFANLEEELEYCKKHGGRNKQIAKIEKKLKEGKK